MLILLIISYPYKEVTIYQGLKAQIQKVEEMIENDNR